MAGEEQEEEAAEEEVAEEPKKEPPKDPPRGYVGHLFEGAFKDLYEPAPAASAPAAEEESVERQAGEEAPAEGAPEARAQDVDLRAEDDEIAAIHGQIEVERERIDGLREKLKAQGQEAVEEDVQQAATLQQRWGLVMREQMPVPESTLQGLLETRTLNEEGLLVPRDMMTDVETQIEYNKGTIAPHDNLLGKSRPDKPGYLADTASNNIRYSVRNVRPTLTPAQRAALVEQLQEKERSQPAPAPTMSEDEVLKNREVMKRMAVRVNFMKNPRTIVDRKAAERGEPCPFVISPDVVVFRNYEAGAVYQIHVEFRNAAKVGRSLRVVPPSAGTFSTGPLRYEGTNPTTAMIAPGMAAHVAVSFAPLSLNDATDEIKVCTEFGDYFVPIKAIREQPQLQFRDPADCGRILAGSANKVTTRIANLGGEGSFRLIPAQADQSCHYATRQATGETMLVTDMFKVEPATFYLESGQAVDLTCTFSASEVGKHSLPLLIECDGGATVPLGLAGIADALRLEMSGWPTRGGPVAPIAPPMGVSAWSLVPWKLSWASPGVQVGSRSSQQVVISNGGFLPAPVQWRLTKVPRKFISRLTVGSHQRLTDDLFQEMQGWTACQAGSEGCPFKVTPALATIAPFSSATFTFEFEAVAPVGHRAINFACLQAAGLPTERRCLLPFDRLLRLQGSMARPDTYTPGLPLVGSAVGPATEPPKDQTSLSLEDAPDASPRPDNATCTVTAICLQGLTAPPTVSCLPKAVIMSGDVLPFVSHARTVRLRNTGPTPACFRVRLASGVPQKGRDNMYDSLWVMSNSEAGARPEELEPPPEGASQEELLSYHAHRLSTQWPPLPPSLPDQTMLPGYGAVASAVVEPHQGFVPAGGFVDLRVTLRALREMDLSAHFMVDLPVAIDSQDSAAPPLKVGVLAAVRAPQVEVRSAGLLDYGVVRAHSRQSQKLKVSNPSDLPLLLRLRHLRDEAPAYPGRPPADAAAPAKTELQAADEVHFPLHSHSEVVRFFLGALAQRAGAAGYGAMPGEPREVRAEPWIHSRDGCMDLSGRGVFSEGRAFRGRKTSFEVISNGEVDREPRVDDKEDFVFSPSCLVLWPHQSAEVDVLLRTSQEGKYRALLEAVGFDSLSPQHLEVWAEVQLPRVRVSNQHVHFPVSYLSVATSAYELEIRNESDLPANFRWEIPVDYGSGLEVQIGPSQGSVPPRSGVSVSLVATPTRTGSDAQVQCKLYVQDVLQALMIRVSATVFGCQVDYAIAPADGSPPVIVHRPREFDDGKSGTHPVLTGDAPPGTPKIDFGSVELLKSNSLQLVLYNRTAIATPFSLKIDKYEAYDPLSKGKCIGDLLEAATRMHALTGGAMATTGIVGAEEEKMTFASQPEPAAQGRRAPRESTLQPTQGSLKFEPKARRSMNKSGTIKRKQQKWLLDDKHEKQAFRSSVGEAFASQKEQREAGVMALKLGRGWAVKVEPATDWLQPFSTSVVTLTCHGDLPGEMQDELIVSIQQIEEHAKKENAFRIPVRLTSFGNPLYLPQQQVGIVYDPVGELDPPQLLCGTITPADKLVTRSFKVGNSSSVKMRIAWKVLPKLQVESTSNDRQLINVALCKRKNCPEDPFFAALGGEEGAPEEGAEADAGADEESPFNFEMWAQDPPEVDDPFAAEEGDAPVSVEPSEALVPAYGTTTFTVTMLASKSTAAAASNYRYRLVGKGRFTEDREALLRAAEEAVCPPGSPRLLTAKRTVDFAERTLPTAPSAQSALARASKRRSEDQVRALPAFQDEPDSDADSNAAGATTAPRDHPAAACQEPASSEAEPSRAAGGPSLYKPQAKVLEEPDVGVLSTIVVEAIGDCILPRLTVDKKADPVQEDFPLDDPDGDGVPGACAVFKFTHSAAAPVREDGQPAKSRVAGATLAAAPSGVQAAGMFSNTVRRVNLSNRNACNVTCRFRVEGPFRIRQVDQAGQHPVKPPKEGARGEASRLSVDPGVTYVVPKLETVTLLVEFCPDQVKRPDNVGREHSSRGQVVVEYPRGAEAGSKTDLQRIGLVGIVQRPAVGLHLVPTHLDRSVALHHAEKPSWGEPEVVHIDFGFAHVEGSVVCKRKLLLSNETGVLARWHLVHVGRKRRQPSDIGFTTRQEEDQRALDDKDAFEFDVCEGELQGPSKGGRDATTGKFVPHYCPRSSALPQRPKHREDHLFEPQEVIVSFKPSKNELYKCRFRIQVESGPPIDFVCRGCGSYDEEDDAIDFEES